MLRPDYEGGGLVNLMASLMTGLGGRPSDLYPPLAGLPPQEVKAAANVVLLLLDGLGHDYLIQNGAGGALCRHLQGPITSVFPPTTAAAVTTVLTAVGPQQHAVTGWFVHLRELGTVSALLPFRPRWGAGAVSMKTDWIRGP
ncbi:MAG: hypothetical protein B7Z66_01355 [Chromatiales bacterium 21-64-14]|nr:MAG: hypothetical protein B7Z66_01355 [Chromatiales bacterium 21-64-14]HQU15980.1 alkaline phosphatase family protein [Gammaproteobacteria bacterium]